MLVVVVVVAVVAAAAAGKLRDKAECRTTITYVTNFILFHLCLGMTNI